MPSELRPQSKRKSTNATPNKAKRVKVVPAQVVEEKLKILEQKERENPEGDDRSVKAENESDEEVENVSQFSLFDFEYKFIYFFLLRMMTKFKIKRWTTTSIMVKTTSIMVKATMMKTTI